MEQIVNTKSILKNKELLSVLAGCVFNPTEERLYNRADKYLINPNAAVYAMKDNDVYKGIIIMDVSNISAVEILEIVVATNFQESGIGSSLINHCISIFHPVVIIAETDDDAVGFYKKFGFDILTLGDKYGAGIMRYKCTLNINRI